MLILAFLSAGEWVVVGLIVVLLFGATKIPELARSLGRAKGEYEKAVREGEKAAEKGKEAATPGEAKVSDEERERVLKAATELGIPTEGRAIPDIKADIRRKLDA